MTNPSTSSTDRTPDAAEWDERYSAAERVWSGEPNGALVAEVSDLAPGRALDVGCGEGADAVWLARRGWQVTALDVSGIALERARRHAEEAGVEVEWVHAGLVEAGLPAGGFELVSAQYAVLLKTPGAVAERALADLVAPGGTLLVVHHDIEHSHDHGHGHDGGFDPELYALPADVAGVLGEEWVVEVDERRPRVVSGGSGAHHVQDLVLRARRRA
ncbi:methyltransferase family protein [Motilibacter peucedani]|uniref:Methyltransferase family protein n=1 Tax=Motilibacter peucedani TaxID=598650 RepID=A0A420XPJ2_9ACTN|nr:class I SAM-dependent methyltransferase [Motilibacter peucedani]RKS74118.1 methyltransferase family protein [Motilibacter peucedani]